MVFNISISTLVRCHGLFCYTSFNYYHQHERSWRYFLEGLHDTTLSGRHFITVLTRPVGHSVWTRKMALMMTSWHAHAFRITDPLCAESTSYQWLTYTYHYHNHCCYHHYCYFNVMIIIIIIIIISSSTIIIIIIIIIIVFIIVMITPVETYLVSRLLIIGDTSVQGIDILLLEYFIIWTCLCNFFILLQENFTPIRTLYRQRPTKMVCLACVCPHWGQAMHIGVSKPTIIVSDNGLSPIRRQAII